MEKDYRLFVKNLPLNIDDTGLTKIFDKYVTIKKIDLKEKKALDNKINKFAFVNVTTTDKGLQKCFQELNGERFDGFQISVELAKESFLERLKREREESKVKKDTTKANPKSFDFENISSAKSNHKKFDDVDFSSKEFEVEKVKKKRKPGIEHIDDSEPNLVQSFEEVEYKSKDFKEPHIPHKIEKKKYINHINTDNTDTNNVWKSKKPKKSNEFNNSKSKRQLVPEKPVSESEKKRLMSLKEKKKVFKAQEQTIRNALRSVDDTKLNKKIIFDDDIDVENSNETTRNTSITKNALFDSDGEDQEEFNWNEEELEAKANTKRKLLKMQRNIGNDKRFVLDERFMENDEENSKEYNNSEQNDDDAFDEKQWQFGILEQVLGKPITDRTAANSDTIQKNKKMIRYDPTATDHEKYEVTVEKPKEEKSKKKKKKNVSEEVQEEAPIPTSKEIFYDVSENLVNSFKPDEGFSLLKTLGRDVPVAENHETKSLKEAEKNEGGFKFSFSSKNPFKYDSSDDEDGNEKGRDDYSFKLNANSNKGFDDDDRLFTPLGNSRIEELNTFFKTSTIVDEETFKRRRRELKKIVRTKIRNNLRKTTPWNKKKVWKQKKKER